MKTRRLFVLTMALMGASLFLSGCGLIDILLADPFSRLGDACALSPIEVTTTESITEGACSADECSIHQAVAAANFCPGEQTILIPEGEYQVENPIDFEEPVSVQGSGSATTVLNIEYCWNISSDGVSLSGLQFRELDGGESDRHDTPCAVIIPDGGEATLNGIWIRRGWRGGNPYFHDFLDGGASIMMKGELNLIDSIIELGLGRPDGGGGIWNLDGELVVEHTEFREATISGTGQLQITESWLNESNIYLSSCEKILVEGTTISNGRLTIPGGAPLTIRNSTISGNDSDGLVMSSSRYCPETEAVLEHVTITNNRVGMAGLYQAPIIGSIVAGNSESDCEPSERSGLESLGFNVDSDGSCGFTAETDLPGVDPLLGPLMENGGPTMTHALLEGSPAIDAAGPDCVTVDQRGVARPVGGGCDSGAYEASFALTAAEPTATSTPEIDVNFNADRYTIEEGECTTLRWMVTGADTITLLGQEREPTEAQEVCPDDTTGYTLFASNESSGEEAFLEIEVAEPIDDSGPAQGCFVNGNCTVPCPGDPQQYGGVCYQ